MDFVYCHAFKIRSGHSTLNSKSVVIAFFTEYITCYATPDELGLNVVVQGRQDTCWLKGCKQGCIRLPKELQYLLPKCCERLTRAASPRKVAYMKERITLDWKDIEIKRVTVDLDKQEISVNGDLVVLRPAKGTDKHLLMTYVVAYATKNSPMAENFNALTWNWLDEVCKENKIQALLGNKDSFRGTYGTCKEPKTWYASGQINLLRECSHWLKGGKGLLENLFRSDTISLEHKRDLRAARRPLRIFLADGADIALIPDISDLSGMVGVVEAFRNKKAGQIGDRNYEFAAGYEAKRQRSIAIQHTGEAGSASVKGLNYTNSRIKKAVGQLIDGDNSEVYCDARSAIRELAAHTPEAQEVVVVGYTSKMFAEDIRTLQSAWQMGHLRILLRDLDVIDPSLRGEIPRDRDRIKERCTENERNIRDIKKDKEHIVCSSENVETKYYRGQPCLRGLLVKEWGSNMYSSGFLSIYMQRTPETDHPDYGARDSVVFRLSRDNLYQQVLLDSFAAWFQFVWEEGSYKK